MLAEILKVKQTPNEPRRRWFASTSLDLFLWYDDDENIIQFQICYDKGPNDGENRTFRMKSTPIMLNNSEFDTEQIAARFEELAGNVEHKTVVFVLSHIQAT